MSRGTLLLALLLAFSLPPPDADAQQAARVYRIGFVSMRAGPEDNAQLDAFRQGLRELGYVEGRNVTLEIRYAAGHEERLPRLEVLREMLPKLSRVGVLWCGGTHPIPDSEWAETRAAVAVLKVNLLSLDAPVSRDLASVFASAAREGVEAVIVFDCSRLHPSAARITELARTHRLPALYPFSLYPETGGLVSYGPSFQEAAHRAAGYVDRILKGARPADLPVEQPTKFELVINAKTARALGLRIPQSVLVRADRIIE